jgi:hypothetical protein
MTIVQQLRMNRAHWLTPFSFNAIAALQISGL